MANRRGTVSHMVLDIDSIKTAGIITAEQRASVRLTRDEKRLIFFIDKALKALHSEERADILKVLNINPTDLQQISETEFRKLTQNKTVAFTKYKYHHDRRLMNYFKVKDFMDQTQRRHGGGRCIYLSKEGSKLLLRKNKNSISNTQSGGGTIKGDHESVLQHAHTRSMDRISERDRSGRRTGTHDSSPHPYQQNFTERKRSMPQIGVLGAEILLNEKAINKHRRQMKHMRVKQNKEFLSLNQENRIYRILNKPKKKPEVKTEAQLDEEEKLLEKEERKAELRLKAQESKLSLKNEYAEKIKAIEKRLIKKQSMAFENIAESKASSPLQTRKAKKRGSFSTQNLQLLNYHSNSQKKPAIKVNQDVEQISAKDDASFFFNENQSVAQRSTQDKRERQAHGAYNHLDNAAYRKNRPQTADYNHKLYERASKLNELRSQANIDNLKISIENKMMVAQEKKTKRIAAITFRVRLDNFKKEQLQLGKLIKMDEILNPEDVKKRSQDDFDLEKTSRPNSAVSKPRPNSTVGSSTFSKMKSARDIRFTSLNRHVDRQTDLTPIKSVGLLESHLQPNTRAALDIKLGQNMMKQHSALKTIFNKVEKVQKFILKTQEDRKYELDDKHEKEEERLLKISSSRQKLATSKLDRIQSSISRKEISVDSKSDIHVISAKSAQGRVWKGLAIQDQQEKIMRMKDIQKAYKERLIDEMFYKEEKYNKIQYAKNQLIHNAQMPTDYGVLGLIEADRETRNVQGNKSLFNVQKSHHDSHEIPTNLQLKNKAIGLFQQHR